MAQNDELREPSEVDLEKDEEEISLEDVDKISGGGTYGSPS